MAGTPTNTTENTNKWSTRQLVTMALMTAIGVLLSFIEFPLLPGVTWLKFDASNMPAMVAGFAYGPGGGVAVGILTAILHGLLMADFSGAVMNIIVVLFYVLPAALIYKRMHTFAGAIIALVIGTLLAVVGAVLGNLVITPAWLGATRCSDRDDRADPHSVQPAEGRTQFRSHAHHLQVDLEFDHTEEGSEEGSRLDDLLRRCLLYLHERKLRA